MRYFKLPDLGEGLQEAEIVEWHVQEGATVKADQPLVSVETAKALVEVPSPQEGVIAHRFGNPGDVIHVGEPLVEFAGAAEDSATVVGELATATAAEEDTFIVGRERHGRRQQVLAAPVVRALAKRLEVDLDTLQGSGPQGQITAKDVEKASALNRQHGAPERLRGVRKEMARVMQKSHSEVVPVTINEDADIHAWSAGQDITIRLAKAIAAGAQAEPALNAWFDGETLSRRLFKDIQLGIAVDTEQGLFVPVLRNVNQRSEEDLRQGLNRLREDVKKRSIPPAELQGATITLSNFGMICGRYANPVVVPPQVCILGAGRVREEAVVIDHRQVKVHRMLPLSLTFDHRAATGGEAARFLREVIHCLERPRLDG
jgi:pyruvate dehydrogenase E2 component (dihydrolipoamide acetyltransferase)